MPRMITRPRAKAARAVLLARPYHWDRAGTDLFEDGAYWLCGATTVVALVCLLF